MNIYYYDLEQEVIKALKENKIWVLSTSENDIVTSRSMSIINEGLNIYFQTNICYIKSQQMRKNNNVSLCYNNISIEGTVEEIGDWTKEKNSHILELYKNNHRGSYDAYGSLEGQVVYKVIPKVIKLWKYIQGQPLREFLYVEEKRAERLGFGDEPDINKYK